MGCLHGGRNILEGGSSQRHMFSVFSLHAEGCRRLYLTIALGSSWGGGGGTVGSLRRFGLKTGKDFAHFGVESGMVYEGDTVAYQCDRRFNSN